MIRLLTLFLSFAPIPLWAETVLVKSGDHAGFSRLFLDYEGGTDWVFGRVAGGYEFRPGRTDLNWDLRRAFQRISRARIGELEDRGNGRLFLSVLCDCHADAFTLRDGQVVIDIKDGPPPLPNSPFDVRLAASAEADSRAVVPQVVQTADNRTEERQLPSAHPLAKSRAGLPLMVPAVGVRPAEPVPEMVEDPDFDDPAEVAPSAPLPPEAPAPPEPSAPARVAQTEAALLEQIARAAAQGMVEADTSRIAKDVRRAADPLAVAPDETVQRVPLPLPPPATAPRSHVAIETGVDRASSTVGPDAPAMEAGQTCPDPSLFDVANWGTLDAAGADIGAYRSQMIGEFDLTDRAGATNLARFYLYLTFGAETKAVLRLHPKEIERPDLLAIMADVMDRGSAQGAERLVGLMECDGATALWSVLAQPDLSAVPAINTKGLTLTFSGLPVHLRRHLGPGLAQKFLDRGDVTTAQRIRNAIERGAETETPQLDLLSARLDLATGQHATADEHLAHAVAKDSETLAEALLTKVRSAIDRGRSVAPDEIALLQSLAFETAGTALGANLLEVEIRARAVSGGFALAFERLNVAEASPYFPPERSTRLRGEVFETLVRDAAAPTFLALVVPRLNQTTHLPGPLRREIAARFLHQGLTGPARDVLEGDGRVPDKEDRVLFARAALLDGDPAVSIGYLAGLDDLEANTLRAEALEAAGDSPQAVRWFDMVDEPDRGTQAAWKGGDWSDLVGRDAGAMAQAAALMVENPATSGASTNPRNNAAAPQIQGDRMSPLKPLAQSQALIDQSRSTRAILETLFDDIAAVPNPAGS